MKLKKTILILTAVLTVPVLSSCSNSYEKAYKKTEALSSYETEITTTVTLNDDEETKTTDVVQHVSVYNEGKKNMRYRVKTTSSSINENGDSEAETESEYTYYNGKYYISMPGVKYTSQIDIDGAVKNIENLTDIISLPYDKMYNVEESKKDGKTVYKYDVEGEDISDYILSLLQSAADSIGDKTFKATSISATATVESSYVTERTFTADYAADGALFTVEVKMSLTSESADVEIPNVSEYADIE
jgi:hypothetical protein